MLKFPRHAQNADLRFGTFGKFYIITRTLTVYFLFFVSHVVYLSQADNLVTANFFKSDVAECLVNVGVTYLQDPIQENVPNKRRCASRCLLDGRCTKFLYCGLRSINCNRIRAFGVTRRTESETQCHCYVRSGLQPCENGGLLVKGSCDCLNGFYGSKCQSVITNCEDGHDRGGGILSDKPMGTAYIRPAINGEIFPVYCMNEWGGYTYIQHRKDEVDKTNFDRTWAEYVEGFGDIEGSYWLGLNQIHQLTQTQEFLDVGVINGDDKYLQVYYKEFEVRDSGCDYTVRISKFGIASSSAPGVDSLTNTTDIDGSDFVTKDHNPGPSVCPTDMRSGWWFSDTCTEANLNGPAITLYEYNNDNTQPRISWKNMGYIKYAYMRVSSIV